MAANSAEASGVLGPLAAGWVRVTGAHAASWFRQVTRIPHTRALNDAHYLDDHALAQITAALPLLGLPRAEQMLITGGDEHPVLAEGIDDPQAMRMILLQILTGRRPSEIRLCDFDCLSATTGPAAEGAQGEQITRFRYAQSKIDIAPDTILVDSERYAGHATPSMSMHYIAQRDEHAEHATDRRNPALSITGIPQLWERGCGLGGSLRACQAITPGRGAPRG